MNPGKAFPSFVGLGLLLPAFAMSAAIILVGLWLVSVVRLLDDRTRPHRLAWLAAVVLLGPLGGLLFLALRRRESREPAFHAFSRASLVS